MFELVIVVAVIAVIMVIAVARLASIRQTASMNSVYAGLRAFANAAQSYRYLNGAFPPDRNGGEFPPEFASFIDRNRFMSPLPYDLMWDWNGPDRAPWDVRGPQMSLWDAPRMPGLWEDFDRRFDNNNILTGGLVAANSGLRNYGIFLDD